MSEAPRISGGALLSIWLMGIVTGVFSALIAQEVRTKTSEKDLELYREVRDFAKRTYIRELSDEEIVERALDGFARSLDEYSRFYDAQASSGLDRDTVGRYAGLGVLFQFIQGQRHVLFALPNSPAAESGMRVGDAVLAVDGMPASGLDDEHFQDLLRSKAGQERVIRLRSLEGVERSVQVVPKVLLDPSVRHFHMVDSERGLAYLSIHSFSRETPAEFDAAWAGLQQKGARALTIDLRGNLGGVLDAAVAIAQRFVPEGTIVSTEGRVHTDFLQAKEGESSLQGLPLVLLVDEHSASASEVLAGALQDHRVAVLVGAPTFGKGMVQTIRRFADSGTSAKVTSALYYSPSHRNFERSMDGRGYGIRPDVEIAMSELQKLAARTYNARYSPPAEQLNELEAWQAELDQVLIPVLPDDPQVRAAFLLLSGVKPTHEAIYGDLQGQ